MKRVLLVDDDQGLLGPVGTYLAHQGHGLEVLTASSGAEAIRLLDSVEVDIVLSDLRMPDGDGIDLLAHLHSHRPALPVIVMSGYVLPEDVEALSRFGHLRCLRKPMGPSAVYRAVMEALRCGSETATVNQFSLAGILQLVEIEEKTCLVKIIGSDARDGSFFFVKGKMQRAVCGALRGEDAALEMLTWEHPTIRVKPLLHMEDAHFGPDHAVRALIEQSMEGGDEPVTGEGAPLPPDPSASDELTPRGTMGDTEAAPAEAGRPSCGGDTDPGSMRERMHEIRLALIIAAMLIVYHVVFNVSGTMRAFFGPALEHPLFTFLNQGLFFWIIGLLWIAFRRWLAASRREADFSAILASTGPELLMVIDANRNVVMCSESVEQVLGYPLREVMHTKADAFFRRTPDPLMEEGVYEALRRFGFHRGEGLGMRKDGRSIQVEIITNRLHGQNREVVLIRDITDRKEHERSVCAAKETAEAAVREREQALAELEESYARLKEAESLRDNLTHMVVHDMKSPLAVVESYIYLVQDQRASGDADENVDEFLTSALAQTRRLSLMVHSLLDASRLEAGRMALNRQAGSIRGAVEAALQFVSTPDVTRRIQVACDLEEDRFSFDQDVLQRVLANLVTNAIKYDEDGADIMIRMEDGDDSVTVSVLDRGPGIPDEGRDRIFEKFGRIDENGRHRSGSSGLGLTFCRMAVEAHGGRIGVSPRDGGGSRFWFTLPARSAPTRERETAAAGS